MGDTIYRDDAVKAVCKGCLKENPHCRHHWDCPMLTNLGKLPSAYRWIPCAERLPSEQGQYLVTFPLSNGDPWVYVLSFCKGKFYETDDEWGDVEYDDVTAWMPLPEPWKGADDEIEMF